MIIQLVKMPGKVISLRLDNFKKVRAWNNEMSLKFGRNLLFQFQIIEILKYSLCLLLHGLFQLLKLMGKQLM
jgi:hypothetical protein